MTWLSPTCSSFLALPLAAASFSGQVTLVDSLEPSVRKLKNYSGVVVWLEPVSGEARLPPPKTFTMLQKGKRFVPHVLAVPVGATVDFPNADPIFHNAFSNFAGQPFDTGLYPPGSTQKVHFRREGAVRVFCNIHATMSAAILVVNTPYFAVTGPGGGFRVDAVPPGEYRVHIWHERAPEATLQALTKRITITEPSTTQTAITISESGHLEIPHSNKYGKEYAPEPAERPGYRPPKR